MRHNSAISTTKYVTFRAALKSHVLSTKAFLEPSVYARANKCAGGVAIFDFWVFYFCNMTKHWKSGRLITTNKSITLWSVRFSRTYDSLWIAAERSESLPSDLNPRRRQTYCGISRLHRHVPFAALHTTRTRYRNNGGVTGASQIKNALWCTWCRLALGAFVDTPTLWSEKSSFVHQIASSHRNSDDWTLLSCHVALHSGPLA